MATEGRDDKILRGGGGGGTGTGGRAAHGRLTDGDGQHLAGRIRIGREINKDNGRMTDDQAPGSGREKVGRQITTDWS